MRHIQARSITAALFLAISTSACRAAPVAPTTAPASTAVPVAPVPTATTATIATIATIASESKTSQKDYEDFDIKNFDPASSTIINNEWFPMKPGTQFVYEGVTDEGGKSVPHKTIFTITDLTKVIEGVRTVVIWDQDLNEGQLVEAELALFAQAKDGNIWHFGQYPEVYEKGKLVDTPAWVAGIEDARPGITIKAIPHLGGPDYSQGLGPAVKWTDRARVIQAGQETCVPIKCYKDVIVTEETSLQEVGAFQLKYYARGVGTVRVDWKGPDESKEKMELTNIVQLDAAGLEQVRTEALKLEKRAYENSKEVYGKTAPAELPTGASADANPAAAEATVVGNSTPKSLVTIEAQVEDIMDVVPGGDWATVSTDIANIDAAWADYQKQAAQDGAPQTLQDGFGKTLALLKTAATAKTAPTTLQSANDLSATVVDLYDTYHPAEPTDLGRLDVLERQVILDVDNKDFAAATNTLAKVTTTWERVKPFMLAHNAAEIATQFEKSLAVQASGLKAQDGSAVKTEALNALEIVDALEKAAA